ncbi:MAG: CCA tRNA nucleotidyltransferase [Alphaproteobacteria bacterium]|jgi:poly(A) polymerase|nr:CCA tRNA nucleotidyltransferase [Alphaproteobacteria bacterium]MBT4082950.1 CCA tRNA nucleotidyltransferase [Alphaproteobacteria bacterium]MBT4544846.1 CCA tRNA nucleotidyltransferase [Alphaproteobacteria bacterium]MBT5917855.1 CCA tRNA nucleotidyltransferase [Alphaproteobacteria bacterium]MBT6384687.1 CCA tRNA nucleotidyltransferase [Alphaproteobacteria bacterium]
MKPAGQLELQPWMTAEATLAVMAALAAGGTQPRFVGGCVRDALLDRTVKDIDIATPDTPEIVTEKLATAGLKSIPTGVAHGTVTAVAHGQPFEVTTLRRDLVTDGRHATVAFTDDWAEDAARRDLTLNAIYCDLDGTLYDPVDGISDLRSGVIRFVGNADDRIKEDVLRILRFFRFFAHYSQGEIDAAGLRACRDHAHQLPNLSAERVCAELLRLLSATNPAKTVGLMSEAGVIAQILPEGIFVDLLQHLAKIEEGLFFNDPLRRLCALCQPDKETAARLARRLRLSKRQKERLIAMSVIPDGLAPGISDTALRKMLYLEGGTAVADVALLSQAKASLEEADWQGLRNRIDAWTQPGLPVKGQDILDLGLPPGPRVGDLMRILEQWWIDQDFNPDRKACLTKLERLISEA